MSKDQALEEMAETSGSVSSDVKAKGDLTHRISYADRIANAARVVAEKEAAKRSTGTKVTPAGAPAKKSFGERAVDMGLTIVEDTSGCYLYEDRFSSVLYRTVKTDERGIMGSHVIPMMAVFTKGANDDEYSYIGPVSEQYKRFQGNASYIDEIIALLEADGYKVESEDTVLSPNNAQIRHSIVLDSPIDIPGLGEVHVMLNISNSYDGTVALTTQAGLWYKDSRDDEVSFTSKENLGSIVIPAGKDKQKDVVTMVKTLSDNITGIVEASRAEVNSDASITGLLKKIEKSVGTRRKEILETILSEEDGELTSWDIFESLSKFSAVEETTAAKRWFETLADSFLVISDDVRKAMK